jgi:hypothetical protein
MAANFTEVIDEKPERPSDAQIKKLPQWAQAYIKKLEANRNDALALLTKFNDTQTVTNIWVNESPHLNLKGGPSYIQHYIQANRIQFKLPRTDEEMEVYVNEKEGRVEMRFPHGYPLLELAGQSCVNVVPKDCAWNLRPNTQTVLQSVQEADKLSHDKFVEKYGYSQAAIPEMMKQVLPKQTKEKKIW